MTELEELAESLMEARGMTVGLQPIVKDQLRKDLAHQIELSINRAILDHMPDDKVAAFNALLDSGGDAEEFIDRYVPNAGAVVEKALEDFAANY